MKLRKSGIAKRLLLCFLCLVLPIILINVALNFYSISQLKAEILNSAHTLFTSQTQGVETLLNNVKINALMLSADEDLLMLNNADQETPARILKYWEQIKKLRYLAQNSGSLDTAFTIYLLESHRMLSSSGISRPLNDSDVDVYYVKKAGMNGVWFIRNIATMNNNSYRYLTYQYYVSSSLNPKGIVISIDIPVLSISNLLKGIKIGDIGGAFTYFENDNTISTDIKSAPLEKKFKEALDRLAAESNPQTCYTTVGRTKYALLYRSICNGSIKVCFYYSEQKMLQNMETGVRVSVLVIAFSTILSCVLIFVAYRIIWRPIHVLTEAMQGVADQKLDISIQAEAQDEFGFMYDQFNQMVAKLKNLINEVYLQKIYSQEVEIKMYQSQINPHFFYNCINFINQSSLAHGDEYTAKMSMFLGRYFRYNIYSQNADTTLRSELDNIITYIKIQNMRFSEKILFDVSVEREVEDFIIPKLLIQPLVENSIVHALEKTTDKLRITVNAVKKDGSIVVSVEDSGGMLTQDDIDELNRKIQGSTGIDTGFGLANVYQRLKIRFGSKANMHLQLEGGNFKVVLTIPQ